MSQKTNNNTKAAMKISIAAFIIWISYSCTVTRVYFVTVSFVVAMPLS
jgi:hypothetical protein